VRFDVHDLVAAIVAQAERRWPGILGARMDLRQLAYLSQVRRSKGESIAMFSDISFLFSGMRWLGTSPGKKGGCRTFANICFHFNEIRVKFWVLRGVFVHLTGTFVCSWSTA
jgi:hypothetical protein